MTAEKSNSGWESFSTPAEVGERIVTARKKALLTQVELAEIVGVSQRAMQAYENGELARPPYRKIEAISKAVQTPVDWLLYGENAFTAPDERLEAIEHAVDRLTRAVSALSKKLG